MKTNIPNPNRPGWRWLRAGEKVRKSDRFQWGCEYGRYQAPYFDAIANGSDMLRPTMGPQVYRTDEVSGYLRKKPAKKRTRT